MSRCDDDPSPSLADEGFDVRQRTIGGRRVVEKAGTGRSRSRLRREGAALELLKSNGVVEVIELREAELSTTLVTSYVGARTLADVSMLTPGEILRAVQETCRVIMDLHNRGWSHGNLTAQHVILGPRARVRLCSLGDATPLPDSGVSQDVEDLTAAIRQIIDAPTGGRTFQERWEWRRMRVRLSRAVEEVAAASTTAGEVTAAESPIDQIGKLLEQLSPDPGHRHARGKRARRKRARRPSGERPLSRPLPRFSARTRGLVVAAAVLASGTVLLTGVLQRGPDGELGASRSRPAPAVSAATITGPATDRAPRPPDDPGNLVVSNGKIYRIGSVGDRVATGDWDCDGTVSALVLRPSTGEVFMFENWASDSTPAAAHLVDVVDGATEFLDTGDDCGPAVVRTRSGSNHQLDLPAS